MDKSFINQFICHKTDNFFNMAKCNEGLKRLWKMDKEVALEFETKIVSDVREYFEITLERVEKQDTPDSRAMIPYLIEALDNENHEHIRRVFYLIKRAENKFKCSEDFITVLKESTDVQRRKDTFPEYTSDWALKKVFEAGYIPKRSKLYMIDSYGVTRKQRLYLLYYYAKDEIDYIINYPTLQGDWYKRNYYKEWKN